MPRDALPSDSTKSQLLEQAPAGASTDHALRRSGIDVVGDLPWGAHFCHFYNTKEDLVETLVPYFSAGLESNELCVCVCSEPLTEQEITEAMRTALVGFDDYLAEGRIEVVSDHDWYLTDGNLDLKKAAHGWDQKLAAATARGFEGLRVAGNTIWLKRKDWNDFSAYEKEVDESIGDRHMMFLCSYPMQACAAAEVLDVARTHQFAVARRNGIWEVVETPELKQTKSELRRLNDELEQRVAGRTGELTEANLELKRALAEIEQLRWRVESENAYLRKEVSEASGGSTILGNGDAIRRLHEQIDMVAPTDATVLILGETGVGKELVARAIHERSPRRERSLVNVNCTAISRELFESEFFGHVKGAFSGATSGRTGRFQLADRGSLFLDELGDLPLEMQPKLLRVLQDGEFHAVGDDHPRHADVRIIAASNHDLKQAIREGVFREDLYYRLSVFPIEVPPLRERKEDITVLASQFVEAACRRFNRSPLQLSASQIEQLQNYDWPGNVRELQNIIERAVITARLGPLHFDIGEGAASLAEETANAAAVAFEPTGIVTEDEMKRRDRENIVAALSQSRGRIYGPGGAADLLGIKPTTLNARIAKLGLKSLP